MVPGLSQVHAIAAGQAHAAALGAGSLYGWGSNVAGQLGAADKEQRRPLQLLAISPREQRRDV
jgi:alpha-tubulin suppressor-like RCC1 family protein